MKKILEFVCHWPCLCGFVIPMIISLSFIAFAVATVYSQKQDRVNSEVVQRDSAGKIIAEYRARDFSVGRGGEIFLETMGGQRIVIRDGWTVIQPNKK